MISGVSFLLLGPPGPLTLLRSPSSDAMALRVMPAALASVAPGPVRKHRKEASEAIPPPPLRFRTLPRCLGGRSTLWHWLRSRVLLSRGSGVRRCDVTSASCVCVFMAATE